MSSRKKALKLVPATWFNYEDRNMVSFVSFHSDSVTCFCGLSEVSDSEGDVKNSCMSKVSDAINHLKSHKIKTWSRWNFQSWMISSWAKYSKLTEINEWMDGFVSTCGLRNILSLLASAVGKMQKEHHKYISSICSVASMAPPFTVVWVIKSQQTSCNASNAAMLLKDRQV